MRTYKYLGICIAALITGCSSIGESDFGCKGMPNHPNCMSAKQVYRATEGGMSIYDTESSDYSHNRSDDPDSESGKVKKAQPVKDPVIDTFVTPQMPDRPVPIRTPSQVMKIWVGAWEDKESNALIAPGIIYVEITPRQWVIGKPETAASQTGQVFKPLEAKPLTNR